MNDGELRAALARWELDLPAVRTLVYRAPTPRERERWWTAAALVLNEAFFPNLWGSAALVGQGPQPSGHA